MNKVIFVVALVAGAVLAERIAVTTSMIREINNKQTSWKAAHNSITRMPQSQARRLLGVNMRDYQPSNTIIKHFTAAQIANAPDEFDSRTNWPDCDTMKEIRNQKHCGSCWAFGAAEAMSDRMCVHKKENVRLSPEDINSCSRHLLISCGSCEGGRPACAWAYWCNTGVVSDECAPYTAGNDSSMHTPECPKKCTGNKALDWNKDKRKGEKHYSVSGEKEMMTEISTNGPIEVAFEVYEDFYSYSSGIYHHTTGGYEGGHAVKMIGYGTENGEKYWLVANSWDKDWGEDGFFRILRGKDECGIEKEGWAGIPK